MITSAADLCVRSPQNWIAEHQPDRLSGPSELRIGDTPIVCDLRCQIGKFGDRLAVVSGHRQFRKNNAQVVLSEGYLPYGAEIKIRHAHRYFDGILRVSTDIHFPRGARANPRLEIGSMTLPGHWTDCRTPEGDWQPVTDRSWSPIPPVLLLRQASGAILEIGLGNDLWRWHAGLLGEANKSRLAISADDDGLQLQRIVSEHDELPMPAQPRTYRFSWYLAWLPGPAPAADFADPHVIDLAELGLDSCLAAHSVTTALKKHIRKTHGDAPILFRGLNPSSCNIGRHIKRKGHILHSDSSAVAEFAAWARNHLGERPIALDLDVSERPLLANLFRLLPSAEDYLMADTSDFA